MGIRELILGIVIQVGVVYLQTGYKSFSVGNTYNQAQAGEIGLVFSKLTVLTSYHVGLFHDVPPVFVNLSEFPALFWHLGHDIGRTEDGL